MVLTEFETVSGKRVSIVPKKIQIIKEEENSVLIYFDSGLDKDYVEVKESYEEVLDVLTGI